MLGFCALAVDGSRLHLAKAQLQANTDLAVLSALTVYLHEGGPASERQDRAEAAANYIFDQNIVAEQYGQVHMEFHPGTFDWEIEYRGQAFVSVGSGVDADSALKIVGIRTESGQGRAVETWLGASFGAAENVDVYAEAVGTYRARDIVLINDITRSQETPEIKHVREASKVFLDRLIENNVSGDRVALVTFTGDGKVVSGLQPIKDADTFRHSFDNIANCSLNADHFYYYYSGASGPDQLYSSDDREYLYPYRWSHQLQGEGFYDYDYMLDGLDDALGGDMLGECERRFLQLNDGTSNSKNWSYGSTMPPCNFGREPGQFYGSNGYYSMNYPGASLYRWYGPEDTRNDKISVAGTRYRNNSDQDGVTQLKYRYTYWGDTGTNHAAALWAAKSELNGARDLSQRVMVMTSDGLPEIGTGGSGSKEDRDEWLMDLAKDTAAEYCSEGISLYTISYGASDDDAQHEFLRELAEDPYGTGEPCNLGKSYQISDSSDLQGIMDEIARDVNIALVQ